MMYEKCVNYNIRQISLNWIIMEDRNNANKSCPWSFLKDLNRRTELLHKLIKTNTFLRQSEVTHQLTPSASTQANLYSLTLNISWRQPATHWTYWELCRGQAQTFTHCEAFRGARRRKQTLKCQVQLVPFWNMEWTTSRYETWRRASPALALLSIIKSAASHMHVETVFWQRMLDQTPDRTRRSGR